MSRRHLSQRTVQDIGSARISRLLDLSEEAIRSDRPDRARRYVDLARRIGMKTRVKMPKDRRYCKRCLAPMMPGVNCTVRLSGHKVVTTCGMCGEIRRTPYLKEQRK
ncbi:MAG: ribonuclease P protein component 4 [Candidatus Methanomethylophilaceae archaeon]|jgi:ribonuclease P protein subunit RPR2|nr:ribonuclease P protein component 4 [Candidatus Methanomethylophilaceae archaeon]MBP5203347.1 ribonuclease P protein component 4 [Candidatus Methanomethylophilaceae archaeon]MBR6038404.1 ribonuclease P protein component 4 [Candidatus Methanomethylophilaceae archaeon]MBR7005848.1 ribonuclease P protein component 4 [Candidatus Methanomethylophilaceae archaeon]